MVTGHVSSTVIDHLNTHSLEKQKKKRDQHQETEDTVSPLLTSHKVTDPILYLKSGII